MIATGSPMRTAGCGSGGVTQTLGDEADLSVGAAPSQRENPRGASAAVITTAVIALANRPTRRAARRIAPSQSAVTTVPSSRRNMRTHIRPSRSATSRCAASRVIADRL